MVGKKIIATETNELWGYRKGDVLLITEGRDDYVFATNLTQPNHYGRNYALLHREEFKCVSETRKLSDEYRFLGIPVLRKYTYKTEVIE